MKKIVFLDRESLIADIRPPAFPHQWCDYPSTFAHDVVERLQGAQIAISNKVPLDRASLEQLPELKLIAVAATGTNNVDLACCRERGIAVCNIRGYAVNSVPEHVFALTLALKRNLIAYREDLNAGVWQKSQTFCYFGAPINDLAGSTMGIVGHGSIGRSVAIIAGAFGMNVLIAEHKGNETCRPGYTPFSKVLSESDVLTLHCPLTPKTENLISANEFRAMKSSALLINTARGGLVNEEDLLVALGENWIAGAGFDVLRTEPPTAGSALLDYRAPNWLVTPHVAWASRGAMQRLADQLVDNIEAWNSGQPQNLD
ncbi:MAG: D-2-hydroxyacid dehydrogenase [Pirellulaceae bacterium]|nr:D-2-hydroxyacid dehydrogenase [Pirellulaceae bacterium]